jgi:hypothetical protein
MKNDIKTILSNTEFKENEYDEYNEYDENLINDNQI